MSSETTGASSALEAAKRALRQALGTTYHPGADESLAEHLMEHARTAREEEELWSLVAWDWLPHPTRSDEDEPPDWAVVAFFGLTDADTALRLIIAEGDGPEARYFCDDNFEIEETDAAAIEFLKQFKLLSESKLELTDLTTWVSKRREKQIDARLAESIERLLEVLQVECTKSDSRLKDNWSGGVRLCQRLLKQATFSAREYEAAKYYVGDSLPWNDEVLGHWRTISELWETTLRDMEAQR